MKFKNTDEEILLLLVEDNKAYAELIQRAFEDQKGNVSIFTALSIFEARSFLKTSHPHLVIADFVLPDGKGTELLSDDKENPPYPIIIMTSQGDEEIAVEAIKAGAFDYVVKSEESLLAMPSIAMRVLREWESVVKRKEAEKALVLAKEEAERANRAKSDFLSRMSHELRTPLNSILGFGQLLELDEEDSLSRNHKEMVKTILRAGDHLLNLINDLLELSRIESGTINLSIEEADVREIIKESALLIKPFADKNGVSLIHSLPEDHRIFVLADITRLKQVLVNLLSNAVKYNREGGGVIITCHKPDHNRVKISVKDTGKGIPEDKQKYLFEPFIRLEKSDSKIEGTGIGLTITRNLVKLMGGTISVDSQPGIGSCFTIDMPFVRKLNISGKNPPVHTERETGRNIRKGKRTVLYIEDDPDQLKLIQQVISLRPNITLLSAPLATLGIELAKTQQPDLILMGINMPDINGVEALRCFRKNEKSKEIPIVAISANALKNDIKKILEEGFTDYIVKPINISQFLKKIDNLIE